MKLFDVDVVMEKIEVSIDWININLEEDRFSEGCKASLKDLLSTLKYYTPTVDAVPVVHGNWKRSNDNTFLSPCYQCSICGRKINTFGEPRETAPYCHCGAKMDGEVDEDER